MIDEITHATIFLILSAITVYAVFDIIVIQGGSHPAMGLIWSMVMVFIILILVAVQYMRTIERKERESRRET